MRTVSPRDIDQLREAPPFGAIAIEGLIAAEAALQDALRFVPYSDEHRDVWSPAFARIILDAASQVDSMLKATTKLNAPQTASDKLTLKDHFKRFGSLVAKQHVVFFGGATPSIVSPFHEWKTHFATPAWWAAYNSLKHDRYSHQTEAKLIHAVEAVAALILAAIYSGSCDVGLISAMLLDPSDRNPWAFTDTGLIRDLKFECFAKIETRLFAHPLGIFGADDCNLSNYWMSGSPRFNIWWALNAKKYTTTRKAKSGSGS
jgi:hypothetical protein